MNAPTTLAEAQAIVEHGRAEGIPCPCCEQFCKLYKRKLNSAMAAWLVWLVVEYEKSPGWIDIRTSPVRGGDYAKLLHWNLVLQRPKDKSDRVRRTSGHWMPTPTGIEFAHGRGWVPSHVFLYNNKREGYSEETVTVHGALGKKFNYSELMGAFLNPGKPTASDLLLRLAGDAAAKARHELGQK